MLATSPRRLAFRHVLVLALTLLVALVPLGAAFAATTDPSLEESSTEAATESAAVTATEVATDAAEETASSDPAPADDVTGTPADESAEAQPAPAPRTAPESPAADSKAADDTAGANSGASANESGPYDSTSDGSPSGNGNGGGDNSSKPCAGCVGNADDKNPPGQLPGPEDSNAGYECDTNSGVGKTNPAHSGCKAPEPGAPAIHLEKDGESTSTVGGEVTYTFAVTNVGDEDLTDVHVTDPMLATGRIELNRDTLPAGETIQVVATAAVDYTIKATDVVNGKVHNTAVAHGTGESKTVTDDDDHTLTVPNVVPRNHTICHATGSRNHPFEKIGPSPVGVIEGHIGLSHQDGRDIIPPFVKSDGTFFPGQHWDAAGQAIFDADCATPALTPSIELEKDGPPSSSIGATITYDFLVTNNGEETLTDVVITDPLIGTEAIVVEPSTLDPGETGVADAPYTVLAAHVEDNNVHNEATVTGTDPDGDTVTDTDPHDVTIAAVVPRNHTICHATGSQSHPFEKIGPSPVGVIEGHVGLSHQDGRDIIPPFVKSDGTFFPGQHWDAAGQAIFDADCATPEPTPAIELVKDGPAVSRVGDTISYDFVVKNNGDETLTDVVITDPLIGTEQIAVTEELAPGASAVADAPYTILAEDVVDENVHNLATVTGVGAVSGETVTDDDPHDVSVPLIVIGPSPGISLVKDGPATAREGDEITYTFVVKNIGESRLINVHVDDPMLGAETIAITPSTLEPGESGKGTATYTITKADAKAGSVHNTAVATGTPPSGGDVSAEDDHTLVVPGVTERPEPSIELEKSGPETARVGDTITYRFRATNTGKATLTNVTITDEKLGLDNLAVTPSTLAPGESGTASATYTVLREDLRRGFILNTALVTGDPPTGPPVTDRDRHRTEVPPDGGPPPIVPPLPATGTDSATTLLLAALTLLVGVGLLRMAKATPVATPASWSIPARPAGGASPPPVHRRADERGSSRWRPRTG